VFPLVCPIGGGAMRILAFVTAAATVRDILAHLGEPPCGGAFMLTLDNTNDSR
jgi:hypothetical protein